jgi:hypothetical protein
MNFDDLEVPYTQHKIFTKKECKQILKMKTQIVDRTTLGIDYTENWLNGVKMDRWWDKVIQAESWIYDRLKEYQDNHFCKTTGQWPLVLKEYYSEEEDKRRKVFRGSLEEKQRIDDFHVAHRDGLKGIKRVSQVINLNDDYEGGELQIFNYGSTRKGESKGGWVTPTQKIGHMILFPGVMLLHRVTKVTSGIRKVIASWYTGAKLNW